MEPIAAAKAVVTKHEELVRSADLDGIVDNAAADVVVLAPDTPLVEGKASFRDPGGAPAILAQLEGQGVQLAEELAAYCARGKRLTEARLSQGGQHGRRIHFL